MLLDIDVILNYQLCGDEQVLLTLEAAQTDGQTVLESVFEIENATLRRVNCEGMGGRRVWAFVTSERFQFRYRAKVEVTRPTVMLENLTATSLPALPGEVLSYLRPSRYCQSDLLTAFVARRFGHLDGGAKIAAILNWVATEITYVPASSHSATTALDTFVAREGVCRDYAHLVCSLARAANIPARYTAVYGPAVSPPDFHAVAQVWLEGAWHLIDATGMSDADGLVVIGSGRDAADVAFMETEDWAHLISQSVTVSPG